MAAVTTAVIGGVTAGAGIIQGFQQNKLAKQAAVAAEKSMAEAKKNIGIIESEARTIPTLATDNLRRRSDLQSEAILSAAQAADPRGLAAVAGQLAQAQTEREANIAAKEEQQLLDIEKDVIAEKKARNLQLADIDLAESARQRQEQMAAREAAMSSFQGALGSVAGTVGAIGDIKNQEALGTIESFKAQTDRETAEASKELNRIRNDQLNFSALQTRYAALLKLYDEISAEEREKFQSRITALKNDPNKRNKESNDKELQAIELEIASNIAKRAGQESDMLGDYNIIAEIKALGERLRNYNFDASRGVRKVSD